MGTQDLDSDQNRNWTLLWKLNDEMAVTMVPVMVYLSILMITGLVGNAMVCFYYGCKTRPSSNSIFICTVAIYDLVSCGLSIPFEITDLRFFYMFTNSGACKVFRFVNHIASTGSVLTLLLIAVDRFRRIYRPFKIQLEQRQARFACVGTLILAVFFSWPSLVFYQSVPLELTIGNGSKLMGHGCTSTRQDSYKLYLWIFSGTYLVIFIASTIVLGVMYTIIGRVIYKQKSTRKRYSMPKSAMTYSSDVTATSDEESTIKRFSSAEEKGGAGDGDSKYSKTVFDMETKNSANISSHKNKKSPGPIDVKTVKFTIIMFVITITFVISFLPYLALVIWRTFQGEYAGYEASVAFQIGIRSYFLNSAINPVTYGFFNSKFRTLFYAKFCPCCRGEHEPTTISTSSNAG